MIRATQWLVWVCLSAALFAATDGWAEDPDEQPDEQSDEQVVLEVDSAKREMRVIQDDKVIALYNPVSVGRWGVSDEKQRGDGKTPLGEYRIAWVKPSGRFGTFMGLDYPSVLRARKGLEEGEINLAEYKAIARAHDRGQIPPQTTPLGGYIGIHGLGNGDPGIHENLDWTEGCIAVTNSEMNEILKLVSVGVIVRIY